MATCSVQNCRSNQHQTKNHLTSGYSYYRFPRDMVLCQEWIKRCQCSKHITADAQICSRHFKSSDFLEKYTFSGKTVTSLKRCAVPSLNLPDDKFTKNIVKCDASCVTVTNNSNEIQKATDEIKVSALPQATDKCDTKDNIEIKIKPTTRNKKSYRRDQRFRNLLHKIVEIGNQNLDVNRQRLKLEKERFEFEKSMAKQFGVMRPHTQPHFNNSNNGNNDDVTNKKSILNPKQETKVD